MNDRNKSEKGVIPQSIPKKPSPGSTPPPPPKKPPKQPPKEKKK